MISFFPKRYCALKNAVDIGVVPRGSVIFAFVISSAVWIAMCIMLGSSFCALL